MAPPPVGGEWDVRFGTAEAVKGWEELGQKASGNTRRAFEALLTDPAPPNETDRQHRLKGDLKSRVLGGEALPQWEYEVTGGGRVRYLVDAGAKRVWIVLAGVGHPSDTDNGKVRRR